MTRSRRTFTAQEKAAIVLRHLVDKSPVSDLSDEFGLQPTQIYAWQKQLTANAALAFEAPRLSTKQDDAKDRKIVALEAKIQQKNVSVLSAQVGRGQIERLPSTSASQSL